jgi:hypothetical protein
MPITRKELLAACMEENFRASDTHQDAGRLTSDECHAFRTGFYQGWHECVEYLRKHGGLES